MNIRKPIDYSAMYTALNTLMAMSLPQMELHHEIGRLVSARTEKGAALAAAEYLSEAYPDVKGFSPRNLRRMRDFYRAYEDAPEALAEAMTIGWTQNVAILEGCESLEERVWYIRAVRQFGWTKAELLEKLREGAYLKISLDSAAEMCYTEENTTAKEHSGDAAAQDPQRHRTGGTGPANGISPLLLLRRPQLLHRVIHTQPLLVRERRGRSLGVADGTGPPTSSGLWQYFLDIRSKISHMPEATQQYKSRGFMESHY